MPPINAAHLTRHSDTSAATPPLYFDAKSASIGPGSWLQLNRSVACESMICPTDGDDKKQGKKKRKKEKEGGRVV